MGSVGTSIFGRPRRLPRHRHAGPVTGGYTLICEEPQNGFKENFLAQLMTIDQLKGVAAGAGILLADAPLQEANLYVLVDPEGNDLYVGKAASKVRHLNEERWKTLEYIDEIRSGIVSLMVENEARRRALRYDSGSFDASKLKTHISAYRWSGGAIDTVLERLIDEGGSPTVEEIEEILVRIHIRAGRLIGNSQFASQWETPIGSFTDTVAALAVHAARISGVIALGR